MQLTTPIADLVKSNHNNVPRRPILTHLNADTAWLISFPKPTPSLSEKDDTEKIVERKHRTYYHVLIDPWLTGTNVVVFQWIMSFTHAITGAFGSIDDVRSLIKQIEKAAASEESQSPDSADEEDGEADAVFVSHFLGDHCNRETLVQVAKDVPVVGVQQGVKDIKSWKHFNDASVLCMPNLDVDGVQKLWRGGTSWSTDTDPNKLIPSWLRIGNIPCNGSYPGLHWATIIVWSPDHQPLGNNPDARAETMLYSPHGIYANRLTSNPSWADPEKSGGTMLAVLHGLNPAWSPQPANLGVQNGWEIVRKTRPKYWIPTHDEDLTYTGIIGWMQTKLPKKFEDVVKIEVDDEEESKVIMRELGNGESFILA